MGPWSCGHGLVLWLGGVWGIQHANLVACDSVDVWGSWTLFYFDREQASPQLRVVAGSWVLREQALARQPYCENIEELRHDSDYVGTKCCNNV
jgi:hypothetical protein